MTTAIREEIDEIIAVLKEEKAIAEIEAKHADGVAEENYALGYKSAHESSIEKLDELLDFIARVY